MTRLLRRLGELGAQLGLFDEPGPAPAGPEPQGPAAAPTPTAIPPAPPRSQPGQPSQPSQPGVLLQGRRVPYQLARAQRRSIGFSVGPEGLKVRAPRWVSAAEIERVLQERGDWILRQLQRQQARHEQQQALRVQWQAAEDGEGALLPFLGAPLRVERGPATGLQPAVGEQPARLQLRLPSPASEAQWRDATQAWLQGQARSLFLQRLAHYAAQLGVALPQLRLSSAKGRWGSASSRGVVSLNWRLVHFSPALIDYVVAHEVAHLREMNHGPGFWNLVGELLPGFEDSREALKQVALPEL